MKKKLRSSRGMTLTEVVIALAIVGLLGVALTTGINGAAKVYRDATRLYEAETLCGTILTYLEDEYRFGRNIQDGGTYDSQIFGNGVKVTLTHNTYGKIQIGGFNLLGGSAYTRGLVVSKCVIGYSSNQVTITVGVGRRETSETITYVEHEVKVTPLYV